MRGRGLIVALVRVVCVDRISNLGNRGAEHDA